MVQAIITWNGCSGQLNVLLVLRHIISPISVQLANNRGGQKLGAPPLFLHV